MRTTLLASLVVALSLTATVARRPTTVAKRHAARRGREGRRQRDGARAAAEEGRRQRRRSRTARRALHWAVRNDDATLVDRLIRAGANAKADEPLRRHADRAGLRERQRAVVERLLKAGVSANATGPLGETALHTVRAHRQGRTRRRCCSRTARRVDAIESWRGQTPLMWAAAKGTPT